MAGLGGFMKGLSSGFLQGQQIQEMNWQRKEKERIKKEEDDLLLTLKMTSKKFSDFYADYNVSDDERLQAIAINDALSYETQGLLKDAFDGVMNYNKEQVERTLATVKNYREQLESLDFNTSTIPELFEMYRGQIKGPDNLKYFDAADRILQKNREALQKKVEKPSIGDYGTGLTYLKNIINVTPENWERSKKGLENKFGFDYSAITQESLREVESGAYNLYATPEEVISNVKAPTGLVIVPSRDSKTGKYYAGFQKETAAATTGGVRATSLSEQEKYKDKALYATTWEGAQKEIKTYVEAGYDPAGMPDKQDWIDDKLKQLDSHVEMLKEITDEEGKLIGNKKFPFMSGDEEETQTGEEWYKEIYKAYMFYLEELKKMGIDVSKYPKIKPPGETKVGFWKGAFTTGGVERGYQSIYYTETTPTPTETEIPKLPSF